MGSIPVGDSDFSFVPGLCHADKFTFYISLRSLKFAIFFHLVNYLLNTQDQENRVVGSWKGVPFLTKPKENISFTGKLIL